MKMKLFAALGLAVTLGGCQDTIGDWGTETLFTSRHADEQRDVDGCLLSTYADKGRFMLHLARMPAGMPGYPSECARKYAAIHHVTIPRPWTVTVTQN